MDEAEKKRVTAMKNLEREVEPGVFTLTGSIVLTSMILGFFEFSGEVPLFTTWFGIDFESSFMPLLLTSSLFLALVLFVRFGLSGPGPHDHASALRHHVWFAWVGGSVTLAVVVAWNMWESILPKEGWPGLDVVLGVIASGTLIFSAGSAVRERMIERQAWFAAEAMADPRET
ncbi:hypothetical protein [Microbacterium amylolyticum]|uniref:Uncharacterized membrane protein YdcZ (DUF606 family) n=2 Tax=Microbacterium amylolyticum TaxID=936337 RepID=A0ABS4ZKR3_9MICO|nr:hypothetical protein [Microbacterium amylolyticum]MBP2437869.1 uncharacterized membrane protein YdcZ (DUF606 family) [Microbacterium amylolyticum]